MAYARKYWNRICSDGFIAQSPTPQGGYKKLDLGTIFVHDVDGLSHSEHALSPDGTIIPWKPIDDCTHFLSCCVGAEPGEHGGGLHVPGLERLGTPGRVPYGIVGAPTFARFLKGVPAVSAIEIDADDTTTIDRARPGDVIAAKVSRGSSFAYEHFMLYLGDGKIACHTYARCDAGGDGWTDAWDNDWNVGAGEWASGYTLFVMP